MAKTAILFLSVFSLIGIAGQVPRTYPLPALPSAHGLLQYCGVTVVQGSWCSENWVPAGPAMDTLQGVIFDPPQNEITAMTAGPSTIDMMDVAVPPDQENTFTTSPNYRITNPIETSLFSLEFNMGQNFWGCNFSLGNAPCGVQVRQGLAHMVDKAKFANDGHSHCVGTNNFLCQPIDNPELLGSGLLQPNPCAWDSSFPESGSQCAIGKAVNAYHLASATGANGFGFLPAPGSPDMNAAAQHFVNAGIATSFNAGTSVLTLSSAQQSTASAHVPNLFVMGGDVNPTLNVYGNSLAYQICYLFTGSYTTPCNYLSPINASAFGGFNTSPTGGTNTDWWMFTEGVSGPTVAGTVDDDVLHAPRIGNVCKGGFCLCNTSNGPNYPDTCDPFDDTLYYTYNSQFVDGFSSIRYPNGPCSSSSNSSYAPADYEFLCSRPFDSLSNQMEFAPCLSASGDPVSGSTSNNSTGTCSGGSLSAIGAGLEAEDFFGKNAFSIPVVSMSTESGYLNGWTRISNTLGNGAPGFMTWLNAWNPSPIVSGTIVQGMARTDSLSPYIARTSEDFAILGNIYDSLITVNPLDGNVLYWMALSVNQLPNSGLTYPPPAGTVQSFRFTLRSDMFFQDGRSVTPFDVAFSYLSLVGTGSLLGGRAASMMTGITVLGPHQFDINVNQLGLTPLSIATLPILPGRYWTADQGGWDSGIATCTSTGATCYPAQYTLGLGSALPYTANCILTCNKFSGGLFQVNTRDIAANFDPLGSQILIGSGPWECGPIISSQSNKFCSSSGTMNPVGGQSYVLTRFGKGLAPGSSISSIYFRSDGNLALYLWSQDTGDGTKDFLNFSVVAGCFGAAITSAAPCAHFQRGIGANGGPVTVGLAQVAIVNRFVGLNWVAPSNWFTSAPFGIVALDPVLYENTISLAPQGATMPDPTGPPGSTYTVSCSIAFQDTNPSARTGGYDC